MSFVSSSFPSSQEWSSSSHRRWCGREEMPVDAPVGPTNWDDLNMQIAMLTDLYSNRSPKPMATLLPIKCDANKFEIRLDVSHYSPEEFTVKIVDKDLVIECKHNEKKDDFGWVSREFTRKFTLPDTVDIEKVRSTLSSAGVLTVEVPKKVFQTSEENVVFIPIIHEKDLVNSSNSDAKSEAQNEAQSEAHSEVKSESKDESKSQFKSEAMSEVKSETKIGTKTETKSQVKSESKTEVTSDGQTKSEQKKTEKTEITIEVKQ